MWQEPFENDVKMYGIQTDFSESRSTLWFDNDVKMYGIQTNKKVAMIITEFDNDVKMYGIQTNSGDMYQFRRLRMM